MSAAPKTYSPDTLRRLLGVACDAARAAGAVIEGARPTVLAPKAGATGPASQVVTDVDHRAEAAIVEALAASRDEHGLALLTEEREDDGGRLRAPALWCVDPLDGTLPFVEGTPGYAVSIALVSRDGVPWIGVALDPAQGTLWAAARGLGLFRDGLAWTLPPPDPKAPLSAFMDRSFRAWPEHDVIVDALQRLANDRGCTGARIEVGAGAVINACRVLSHPPACYFKPPTAAPRGGSLWDYAATACLFAEAGAIATDLAGAPLDLNRAGSTYANHRGVLFATDPDLAAAIRSFPFAPSRAQA